MSSDKYQLYYFGLPGRSATIRILLHVANVDYDFVALNKEKFVELKQQGFFPFGKVPVLTKGDWKLAESGPIGQYLAKKHGFWPKSEEDSAVAYSILSGMGDYVMSFYSLASVKPEEKEEKLKEALEKFAGYEAGVSKILGENEYLFESKLSYADICLFYFLDGMVKTDNLKHENLKKYVERVKSRKDIAEYFSKQ